MKTLIASLAFSFAAFSQVTLDGCLNSVTSPDPEAIPQECSQLVKQSLGSKKSNSPLVEAYGIQNILYFEKKSIDELGMKSVESVNLFAGDKTKLSNILGIELNPEDFRVLVLNQNEQGKQVYSYRLDYGGNIAPIRKLISEEINSANGFKVSNSDQKIYVFSSSESWIKAFNYNADPDGFMQEHSCSKLAELGEIPEFLIDIAIGHEFIYTLFGDRVLAYDKGLQDDTPKALIDGTGIFEDVVSVSFEKNENALKVLNREGVVITFIKDEAGNFLRVD